MKRTILISLAAGVAIVPAMLGVAFASNGHGADDIKTTPSASATSTADDRNQGRGADDSATSSPTASNPTSSATVDDRGRGRGSDDATASSASSSATSSVSADDRGRGRGSTMRRRRQQKSATSAATTVRRRRHVSPVDDKGRGVEAGDDSGGHGAKSGKN